MKRIPAYLVTFCAAAFLVASTALAQEPFVPWRPTVTIKPADAREND